MNEKSSFCVDDCYFTAPSLVSYFKRSYPVMHMQILFTGRQTTSNMTFFFVNIQNLTGFTGKRRIDLYETIRHIFMFGCH